MKTAHIKKLLGAAEARMQLERTNLAALRNARARLLSEADAFELTARRRRLDTDQALTGADIANYDRDIERLQAAARGKRVSAADYDEPIAAQEDIVRAALRRELAWKALFSAAREKEREEFEKREETIREETSLRGSKRATG